MSKPNQPDAEDEIKKKNLEGHQDDEEQDDEDEESEEEGSGKKVTREKRKIPNQTMRILRNGLLSRRRITSKSFVKRTRVTAKNGMLPRRK
jgi:hypothetical protein